MGVHQTFISERAKTVKGVQSVSFGKKKETGTGFVSVVLTPTFHFDFSKRARAPYERLHELVMKKIPAKDLVGVFGEDKGNTVLVKRSGREIRVTTIPNTVSPSQFRLSVLPHLEEHFAQVHGAQMGAGVAPRVKAALQEFLNSRKK